MTLPDFIIIGAAKAGTTSLYAMLDRHPDIFMPRQKEPEFFARDDLYAQGLDSYAENFAGAKPGQVVGEASTLYSLSPLFGQTAARIKEHLPESCKRAHQRRRETASAKGPERDMVGDDRAHHHPCSRVTGQIDQDRLAIENA